MDTGEAAWTLILAVTVGPIIAYVFAVLVGAVLTIQHDMAASTDGEMQGGMEAVGHALEIGYGLFQLGSVIEVVVAIAVIGLTIYAFASKLVGR